MSEHDITAEDRAKLRQLCELQDAFLEHIPKTIRDTDYSTLLGVALECNMDILREVACREQPHGAYIGEKMVCVEKYLRYAGIL